MASLVRLILFFAIVAGGPVLTGFLVAPGSWADERYDTVVPDDSTDEGRQLALAQPLAVEPETGWWWTPAEPGRGFVIERSGARLMVGTLTYDSDGSPAWYLSAGTLGCSGEFRGALAGFAGGPTLAGRNRKAEAAGEAGWIAISFSTPTSAQLTLPNGRMLALERYRLGGGVPTSFTPEPGWWWNPAEPGRGFAIEVRHGAVLLTGTAFDDAGRATWYVSYGLLGEDRSYKGRWYRLSGGATLDGAHRMPEATDAGAVSLKFVDDSGVILTQADGRSVALSRFDPAPARGLLAQISETAPKDCGPEVKLAAASR